jgi:hypothetical protein
MHTPFCHGTFCRHPWVCAWRPPSGVQRVGFCRPAGHQPHHTSARKSLRDFTVSVPFAQEI